MIDYFKTLWREIDLGCIEIFIQLVMSSISQTTSLAVHHHAKGSQSTLTMYRHQWALHLSYFWFLEGYEVLALTYDLG